MAEPRPKPDAAALSEGLDPMLSGAPKWLAWLLRPGSSLSAAMWVFLNSIFVALFAVIALLYYMDVGGIHTIIFGLLFLGLVLSANWLFYEVMVRGSADGRAKAD
eukprot:RCo045341